MSDQTSSPQDRRNLTSAELAELSPDELTKEIARNIARMLGESMPDIEKVPVVTDSYRSGAETSK